MDAWLAPAFGPGYREILERALPGAFEQAIRDADVNHGAAWAGFGETHGAPAHLAAQRRQLVVPTVGHLLQIERPAPSAAAIGGFLARRGADSTQVAPPTDPPGTC